MLFITLSVFSACTTNDNGEKIAREYCSSCHLFPEPSLLDKDTWKTQVLPAMGKLMGVAHSGNDPFEDFDNSFGKPSVSLADKNWRQVVAYYLAKAPATPEPQQRPVIQNFTNLFETEPATLGDVPGNTFIKIDPGNKWIYAANRYDSSLYIYDNHLKLVHKELIHGVVTDMCFDNSMATPGPRQGVLTKIGIMDPNDSKTGSLDLFHLTSSGLFTGISKIFDSLQRPVQGIATDLDMDGKTDYIICGFGNTTGAFFWMQHESNNVYKQKMLRPLPGSIKAYVDDSNLDGLPDIITLFAQAREGICLFINKGNGLFDTTMIADFPPVYGSSYFELCDMNGDGYKDIIYTCGDNADYSSKILKNYHGIYIFLNNGNFHFKQQYFFPMHGAYKAVARDFDMDGDIDIAAISFFPDRKKQPQESFVYLQNKGHLEFEPFAIREFNEGHWITMDAQDVDGDGDDDIVIGSLFLPEETLKADSGFSQKPFFLLLKNLAKK